MRKKYLSALLFGAMITASTGTFTSCKDYDADIKNLQEQIDGMTSKLDLSKEELTKTLQESIAALQASVDEKINNLPTDENLQSLREEIEEKTTALNAAIESKADKATIDAALSDLQSSVNGFNTSLESAKSELQNQINDLKGQLANAATQDDINTIEGKLIELSNQLNTLNSNLGTQISNAQTKIDNINAILGDIEDLPGELDDLSADMAGKITDAISGLKDELLAEDGEIMTKIAAVEAKIQNYVLAQDPLYISMKDNIDDLISWKNELLTSTLNGYVTTETFNTKVTEINGLITTLETKIFGEDGLEASLEKQISDLRDEMNSILGKMIQSIVYKPVYKDGQVLLNKLMLRPGTGEDITLIDNNKEVIEFRVSPASAAANLMDNYTLSFEGELLETRATTEAGLLNITNVDANSTTGIVKLTIEATEDLSISSNPHALCLKVTAKKDVEGSTDKFTEITSDYFQVLRSEVTAVAANTEITGKPEDNSVVYWNDESSSIDFSGVKLLLKDANGTSIDLNQYPGWDDKLTWTYVPTNTEYFIFEGKELKLKSYTPSSDTQNTDVSLTVQVGNTIVFNGSSIVTDITAERKATVTTVNFGTETVAWSNSAQTITVDMNEILDQAGITADELEKFTYAGSTTGDVKFVVDDASRQIQKIDIKSEPQVKSYDLVLTYTNDLTDQTIIVKKTVVISVDDLVEQYKFELNPAYIGNESGSQYMIVNPKKENGSINWEYSLKQPISNFDDLDSEVPTAGGDVIYNLVKKDGTSAVGARYSNGEITLDPSTYSSAEPVYLKAEIVFGGEVTQSFTAKLNVANLSGKWTAGTTSVKFTSKTDAFNLFKGYKWTEALGTGLMWGEATDGAYTNNTTLLGDYGLDTPSFKLEGEAGDYLTVLNGVLTLKNDESLVVEKTFTITIKAESRWGEIEGYAGHNTITVTIPANLQ